MKSVTSNTPANVSNKTEREIIHSGHFMVSTFEAEEAQDDLDDSEIKMLDPEDPSLAKPGEASACTEVQLYVPRKVSQQQQDSGCDSIEIVTSHLEIETSLTKLFKCMSLAYSQKLTSPKWNHFKGVRLRWKDKIRLNNVIWRCWHMQFILKRKTLVCQFASPLDVDIHSNPQSVILEGKYWKRQLAVIKAEYRKWRRNYKSTMMGLLTYDTKSELDFLDWSPINDKTLMTNEDWTTDTLFSAINVPFPFPDSREIARGAGIADFIQPSLGPLQPNLDDIDLTFVELLQNTRLPSVPEEGSEEILRNVEYNFSDIIGDQMNASTMISGSESIALETTLPTNAVEDANMMELIDTPLNDIQYNQIEPQMPSTNNIENNARIIKASNHMEMNMNAQDIMNEAVVDSLSPVILQQMNSTKKPFIGNSVEVVSESIDGTGNAEMRHGSNDFHVKKGRITKSSQRSFRREPHNYDKAQPTMHQTNMYQQMLAEQQKIQQYCKEETSATSLIISPSGQRNSMDNINYGNNSITYTSNSLNSNVEDNDSNAVVGIINNNNNGITVVDLMSDRSLSSTMLNVPTQSQTQQNVNTSNVRMETPSAEILSLFNLPATREMCTNDNGAVNLYKSHPHMVGFKKSISSDNSFNLCMTQCPVSDQSRYISSEINTQKQIPPQLPNNQTVFNKQHQPQLHPNSIGNQMGISINDTPLAVLSSHNMGSSQRSLSSVHVNTSTQIQSPSVNPLVPLSISNAQSINHAPTKEIYRSNSLPLNVTLPNMAQVDKFVMPVYHHHAHVGKGGRSGRLRSNSIHLHHNHSQMNVKAIKSMGSHVIIKPIETTTATSTSITQLKSTTSEPILNSALSQLLTTKPHITMPSKQQSASNIVISNTDLSTAQNKLIVKDERNSYMLPSLPIYIPASNAMESETVSRQYLKHSGEIQDEQEPPYKSPKKFNSLPQSFETIPLVTGTTDRTQIIKYPGIVPKTGQTKSNHNSSSPIESQIFVDNDIHHDVNSPASGSAATLSPAHIVKCTRDNTQNRRFGHIHAEQKRRYNIKSGFDQLHDLIPQLQQHNVKLSKAAMLQKGVEHIKHLRNERNILKRQMDNLKLERDALNNSLTHLQSILPANGSPATRQGTESLRKYYEEYINYRTKENWKFWILGLILEPLLTSYISTVSSANLDELRRTAFLWIDQHCSLVDLRPAVSNKLKYLSMKTDLLSDPPSNLRDEVIKAMANSKQQHPNLHDS